MARAKKARPASKVASGAKPRSRAVRRETSPSINTDKSLKDVPHVSEPLPVLSARTNAGISKSKSKRKTRNQRIRQEKGMARAEAVMDHLEKKVECFKKKERSRRARKSNWDEVNGIGKEARRNAVLGDTEGDRDENEWEDEPDDETTTKMVDGIEVEVLATDAETKLVIADMPAPVEVEMEAEAEAMDETDLIT